MGINGNNLISELINNNKDNVMPFVSGVLIIIIVIIDLLMTRQLLNYDSVSGNIMFICTIIIGYAIGSFILLRFAHKVSKDLRKKSRVSYIMHWSVVAVQGMLLVLLIIMLLFGNPGYNLSRFVFAVSSVLATAIMIIITYKFFSWYKASKYKNPIVFFYALAALTLACSIIEDASTKLLMVHIIYENEPQVPPIMNSSFQYKDSEKYEGQIVFVDPHSNGTAYFVIPNHLLEIYNYLNSIILPIGFIFRWIASTMLLRNIYSKISNMPISLWIVLSLPLILYLIGKMPGFLSGESLEGIDEVYRYFFRILFRVGTIAGNILFGLAFFIVAKKMRASKMREYLVLAGIGDTIVGISLSTSAIEPSFGVAGHSLVLISTYLFTLGLYSSAITVSQDLKLRQSIRDSAIEQSKLLVGIGSAQMVQEIEKKVTEVVEKEKKVMGQKSGIQPSFSDQEAKRYLSSVLKDIKIIQNVEDIVMKSRNILMNSREFVLCTKVSGLELAYNNYFEVYKRICRYQDALSHGGIKIATSIMDSNDIQMVNRFLALGIEIRHVRNLPPINFAASEKEMIATIEKSEGGQIIQNLLTTNEKAYLEHFKSIFDELWKNGIDAQSRIKDIELGIDKEGIEIIQNPEIFEKVLNDLLRSASDDIVGIFSTARAFIRQKHSLSTLLLNDNFKSSNLKIRILVPEDQVVFQTINEIEEKGLSEKVKIRLIEPSMQTRASIVVIDRKHSLAVEVKDDTKTTTKEAIGLVTYSNSKSTVLTYYSIFESFWRQAELYKQLQSNDKMQKEFINTAAHELRTPIQPIIGAMDILKFSAKEEREKGLVEIVDRNAKRLKKLAEDILDVTRIEGYSMNLKKDEFRINEIVTENVENYKLTLSNKNIIFNVELMGDPLIQADRNGISRVLSNLVSNSIKFLPEDGGRIDISSELLVTLIKGDPINVIQITVRDNGSGIDSEVFAKLFTKFNTKSFHGIGLGLFISKNIVEAHNGCIWVINNSNGQGATFAFYLPITFSNTPS
ncbi:sensor histidine kinase [Candidatus Nitrosocosmicus hydrocola]|uniref:sensor histidine kinase n=1 Tax=Candidatus Nitrosocosmicus hydrocola TaxID=1826872 RepID=UPI00137275B8|nr:HAMP domain-containing sensor histidine kinase [Candidatus Nitrosocosmicus hydrocola]